MIPDEEPPNWKPNERQRPFDDQHLMPIILAKQPASDWSGAGNGKRLAKIPISIRASALRTRKPVGQQNERRWKDAALRDSKKKPHEFELVEGLCQAAPDRAYAPGNQEHTDNLAGTPAGSPVSTPHLQQNVSKKEDACRLTLHFIIHEEILHHGGNFGIERERDVGAIDVRDRVHDQRHRDDAQPALLSHNSMVSAL